MEFETDFQTSILPAPGQHFHLGFAEFFVARMESRRQLLDLVRKENAMECGHQTPAVFRLYVLIIVRITRIDSFLQRPTSIQSIKLTPNSKWYSFAIIVVSINIEYYSFQKKISFQSDWKWNLAMGFRMSFPSENAALFIDIRVLVKATIANRWLVVNVLEIAQWPRDVKLSTCSSAGHVGSISIMCPVCH